MSPLERRIAALEERLEEERIAALETAIGVLLPETDAIRSPMAALLAATHTRPECIDHVADLTGSLIRQLSYGTPAITRTLQPRAADCTAAILAQAKAALSDFVRSNAAGTA